MLVTYCCICRCCSCWCLQLGQLGLLSGRDRRRQLAELRVQRLEALLGRVVLLVELGELLLLLGLRVLGPVLRERPVARADGPLHRGGAGRRADIDRQHRLGDDRDRVGGLEAARRTAAASAAGRPGSPRPGSGPGSRPSVSPPRGSGVGVVDQQDRRGGVVGGRVLQVQPGTDHEPDHGGEAPDPGAAPQGGREEPEMDQSSAQIGGGTFLTGRSLVVGPAASLRTRHSGDQVTVWSGSFTV